MTVSSRTHPRAVARPPPSASATGPPSSTATPRWTWAELHERGPHGSAPRWRPPGIERGDRVAIWAPTAPSGSGRARALAGGRRARAGQHPVQGRRGGRHPRPQPGQGARHRHRLPRHRLRRPCSSGADLPDLETTVVARGPARRARRRGTTSWPGDRRAGPRSTDAPASAPTTRPTSSSPPGPPACPRAWS